MKYISIIVLTAILFIASCGKKEETQNIPQQKDTQQLKQQQTTNNGQTQQQQSTNQTQKDTTQKDIKKTDDKKTDDKKTETDKKTDDKKTESDKNTDSKVTNSDNPKTPPQATDIDFAPIFAKKCAKCHGKNGHGKPDGAPDLTSSDVRDKTDKKLFSTISNGVKAKNPDDDDMPAWKGKLTDDEINAAIKYIRNLP